MIRREDSIERKTLKSILWNIFGTIIRQGFQITAMIVIARYLTPVDFAIGGLAITVFGMLSILVAVGFSQALIRQEVLRLKTCHTVFSITFFGGILLSFISMLLSNIISEFYDQSKLISLFPLISAGLFFYSIGAVPTAILQREMKFKTINIVNIFSYLIGSILGIVLAVFHFGYYAIVISALSTIFIQSIACFFVSGYHPKFLISKKELKEIRSFGFSQLFSNILLYLNNNADYLIFGKLWSLYVFGQYFFAFEKSRQAFDFLSTQLGTVFFPFFSKIQNDIRSLRNSYFKGTHSFCLIIFPLHILLIAMADPLIPFVFGEQWRPSITAFRVFSSFAFIRSFSMVVPLMLLALNKAHLNLKFNVFRLVVILPALFILSFFNAGMNTVSIVCLIIWILQTPIYINYLFKEILINLKDFLINMKEPLFSSFGMTASFLLTKMSFSFFGFDNILTVSTCAFISLFVYFYFSRNIIKNNIVAFKTLFV